MRPTHTAPSGTHRMTNLSLDGSSDGGDDNASNLALTDLRLLLDMNVETA